MLHSDATFGRCVLLFLVLLRYSVSARNKYIVSVDSHSPVPILSRENTRGKDCIVFNPSYIPSSPTFNRSGLLVRQCCGSTCAGHGRRKMREENANLDHAERIGFADCDAVSGTCATAGVDETFNLDPDADTEDPRAFYWNEWYYLFYYRSPALPGECTDDQCTVQLSKTKTPLNASSWIPIVTLPWHRNGCCLPADKGQRTYCMWGEGPGPFPGLGISFTTDIDAGNFTRTSWRLDDGGLVNNASCPLSEDNAWLLPLGAEENEIKLEAGTHLHKLRTGDIITFYAAATPGWVANGNYTVGWLVLDGNDPTRVLQRSREHLLVPTFPYETLCEGDQHCPFVGERKNVIFVSSAVEIDDKHVSQEADSTRFRLFFGGGDGNVGTAVVTVGAFSEQGP